jgi:uncharacterized phage-associated protein
MYSPVEIGNWFLCSIDRDAGDSITHLKLQKLVYYAQAWSLVLLERPLFEEDFEAWAHGPVAPSLYGEHKGFGWDSLPLPSVCNHLDDDAEELLTQVLDTYGQHSAKHLEALTHDEAPWTDARGDLAPEVASSSVISKESMHVFYTELYKRLNEGGEEDTQ